MTSTDVPSAPPLSHILETILYVRDLENSVKFYAETLQVQPFFRMDAAAAFAIGNTTLLLFKLGSTDEDRVRPGGVIPKHGPTKPLSSALLASQPQNTTDEPVPNLRQHFCFAVPDPDAVTKWDKRLQKLGVKVTARMEWERGGKSVYFEDPDGHVGEIGSRGIWPNYALLAESQGD